MKGCIASRSWDVAGWFDSPEPKRRITDFLDDAKPLVKWLDANVGPTGLEDRR